MLCSCNDYLLVAKMKIGIKTLAVNFSLFFSGLIIFYRISQDEIKRENVEAAKEAFKERVLGK